MNPVLTRPASSSARLARIGALILVPAVGVAALIAVTRLVPRDVSYVKLSIENPLPYQINTEVTGAERDGWFDLGAARRQRTHIVEEVVDQGEEWVFRFSYGGVPAGELVIRRTQLAADGWMITVPTAVADRLREAGLSESAT